MKSKKALSIPGSYYEFFGIYVPGSDNPDDKVLFPDSSGRFFSGSERINTLVKESRYKSFFPILKKINLLSLSYPSLPQEHLQKMEYVKKVIKSSIRKSLVSISPEGSLNTKCCDHIESFFRYQPDSVSVKICHLNDDPAARIACQVFYTTEAICITLSELDNIAVYANPFSSKKVKKGYYHLRSNPSQRALIIDLPELLADASLFNALYESLTGVHIPLVQNTYKRYADIILHRNFITTEEKLILEFIRTGKPIPYKYLFHSYQTQSGTFLGAGMPPRLSYGLYTLFCEILEISQDISQENGHREQMTHSIATAYMTKKNIPETVLSAMEHTGFMHYFKFVEFDEDIDLESVSAIEKEFKALNSAYFYGSIFPDVKIRFRKLGKHKASGLYYPSLDTLCVDIRYPSSFIHEYFHMLDDQLGDPSLDPCFEEIVTEYKKAFLKGLAEESSTVKAKMNGSSKYNIRYFFRRAEIFARCGEIYLVRILGVESSLLKPDLEFAYPKSEALDLLINGYYKNLLQEKLAQSSFARAC